MRALLATLRYLLPLTTMLSACAWWMAGRQPGGDAVATDTLIFSHALHTKEGIACDDCHGETATLDALSSRLLPKEAVCLECHDREPDGCGMCHQNLEARAAISAATALPRRIRFSHAKHLPRVGDWQLAQEAASNEADSKTKATDVAARCEACHGEVRKATTLPLGGVAMSSCLQCHEHKATYQAGSCLGCHPSLQSVPLKAVAEFAHVGDWEARHGHAARVQGAACMQCHTQTMCTTCHAGAVAPGVPAQLFPERITEASLHRGDFVSTHQIDARFEADTCVRCHATSECRDCHAAVGIAYGTTSLTYAQHPAGYAIPGGSAFHGTDARQNIVACAACHDQGAASNCVDCHAVGKGGASPHPPGWAGRDMGSETAGDGRCVACHAQ